MERRGTPTLATNFKRRRGEERENEEGKKGHAIQRNMHFTVGSAIRDWYRPGAMGNDSAKAGCQDRSDLSKDSLLLLPFSSLPSQRSGNRSRGFGQGFFSSFSALVPALSPFPRICILSLERDGAVVNSFGLHRVESG